MQEKIKSIATIFPRRVAYAARLLLRDEAISGKLILIAAFLALVVVNSPLRNEYAALWHTTFSVGIGDFGLSMDLRHWINEGLMAIFFLVVGLEIKREIVRGELHSFRAAALPIGAALGGMVVPALIYGSFNHSSIGQDGWAIPMATDIALALGLLTLLGKRVPTSLKLFLLTLAIADDIGAIIVIAVFYNTGIHIAGLIIAALIAVVMLIIRNHRFFTMPVFILLGVSVWLAMHHSGVHASIAGVIIGLVAPHTIRKKRKLPIAEQAEIHTIPTSTLLVVPLFVFANTGVPLSLAAVNNSAYVPVTLGIILGLVVGKVVGIVAASWLLVKLKLADLPRGVAWPHMIGVGLMAGIGFTVSIFVTELAFTGDDNLIDAAKMSIFAASLLSAAFGFAVLRLCRRAEDN